MSLPTVLTCLRILLTFVTMALLFLPGGAAKVAAFATFLIASATDWLDGYLARRWRQTSALGALLDPIADKVLVLGMFLAFIQLDLVPGWMVLVIAFREFLITGVRLFAAHRHVVLPAASEGKHKTVSQVVTLIVLFLVLIIQESVGPGALSPIARAMMDGLRVGCLWVTMLLTLVSGTSFFLRHRTVLKDAISR